MKKQEIEKTRRAFLKGALITGGAAAAAIATGEALTATKDAGQPQSPASTESPESIGYHVTDHIQEYYKTARE